MLQKSSMWKVLEVFFVYPTTEHNLIDISRKIDLAHTSVKNIIKKLIIFGLITEKIIKKGTRKFPVFKANLENPEFKKYKKIYNLSSLLESGLLEFLEEKLTPRSIIVFGSYQKGDDIEDSDIDLFIECEQEVIDTKKYERKLKRKIQLHFNKNFNSFSKELKNNIINGTILVGFLEGYK